MKRPPKRATSMSAGVGAVPGSSRQPVPQAATNTVVRQGYLEGSNVNTLEEMVRMIETTRSSETCQKMIQNYDQMTAKAVNELGKV